MLMLLTSFNRGHGHPPEDLVTDDDAHRFSKCWRCAFSSVERLAAATTAVLHTFRQQSTSSTGRTLATSQPWDIATWYCGGQSDSGVMSYPCTQAPRSWLIKCIGTQHQLH